MAPKRKDMEIEQLEYQRKKQIVRMPLKVQTYSGYKADERPVAFTFGEKVCEVEELIDRWYGVDHAYFKLRANDGNLYVLRHRMDNDQWEMVLMEAGGTVENE